MRILYLPNSHCQQRQFEKPNFIAYPVLMAMEAEWYRQNGDEVDWGCAEGKYDKIISKPERLPFLSLPSPDRIFTKAKDKAYQANGNFKYHPGTYIQSTNGCWWGKCSFCCEQNHPYERRPVKDVLEEIDGCVKLGFREIFDDSATFPTGKWLEDFCTRIRLYTCIKWQKSVTLGCNMRMVDVDYKMMKQAGFRMLLFGLESANQETLDRIKKGVKVEDVKYIKKAAEAGLEPHIAVIFGYPWETDRDSIQTLKLVHSLLKNGYAKTAQASFYQPRNEETPNESQRKYVKKIYDVAYSPNFWFNKIRDIKNTEDLKYLWKQIKAGLQRK